METNTTKKKAGRPSTKKTAEKEETKVENKQTDNKPVNTKKKIPLDTNISCKSAVRGTLTYLSKRMAGYQVVWNDFGDEEFLDLQELISMRNTDLRFFKDNWIIIDDSEGYTAQEIMDYIKVSQYYNKDVNIDNFDSLFNEKPDKIKETVSKMSSGLKETVAIRAKQLYNSGNLYDLRCIKALEESLGVELEVRS
jgi:replicative DNA helicase